MDERTRSTNVAAELAARIEASDDEELVDVIVELGPAGERSLARSADRRAAMAAAAEDFHAAAEPVVRAIVSCGGEVTGEAWINQTLRARVPARSIRRIAEEQTVAAVDVPRALEPDSD